MKDNLMSSALQLSTIPYARRVFVNRTLRMDHIQAIGFDMDYTLAVYTTQAERLTWTLALQRVVKELSLPQEALSLEYDPTFTIRGLVIDTMKGNILKVDGHKFVQRALHGTRQLDHDEIRALYRNTLIKLQGKRFFAVDSLFERPEVYMYATLVDLLERLNGNKPLGPRKYSRLFWTIRRCVDEVHADGSLKGHFVKDLPRYIEKLHGLGDTLHILRSSGKKLFLLTNSEWTYVQAVMSYLLDDARPEYRSWRHYFDLVVVSSGKPGFFTSRTPFVEIDPKTGEEVGGVPEKFERDRVYARGNLKDFEEKWTFSGDAVLYVGDNIYADIVRSKKRGTWRTALIIPEMEEELQSTQMIASYAKALLEIEKRMREVNLKLRALKISQRKGSAVHPAMEETRRMLKKLLVQRAQLEHQILRPFNPRFGMLFKEGSEHSLFGAQVEAYACIYTSSVLNLGLYSPLEYYRSPHDFLPHEVQLFE